MLGRPIQSLIHFKKTSKVELSGVEIVTSVVTLMAWTMRDHVIDVTLRASGLWLGTQTAAVGPATLA